MPQLKLHDFKRLDTLIKNWLTWQNTFSYSLELVRPIYGGLTNHNFLLKCGDNKFVARLNNPHSSNLGIDRQTEISILNCLKHTGLTSEVIYWHQPTDITLFKYIDGRSWNQSDLRKHSNTLADAMNAYQQVTCDVPHIQYDEYLKKYWQILEQKQPSITQKLKTEWNNFSKRVRAFSKQNWERKLTHHDLTASNIIETDDGIKIIDWEYASLGHPAIDAIYAGLPEHYVAYPEDEIHFLREMINWMDQLWRYINK